LTLSDVEEGNNLILTRLTQWQHLAFQLMTIGLLNTAGFQKLKYSDQGIFRTSRSTFIS